jgi:hypothetical protein
MWPRWLPPRGSWRGIDLMAWRAQERCYNDSCARRALKPGEIVCQVVVGEYWPQNITPTRRGMIGEWHVECFEEGFSNIFKTGLAAEQCYFCKRQIKDREEVIYAVRGFKHSLPSVRPESRGEELLFVICKKCMRERTNSLGRIGYWYRINFAEDISLDELRDSLESREKLHGC